MKRILGSLQLVRIGLGEMNRQLRIGGVIGLVAPFFIFVCILLAVASWAQFSWVTNALSDLGVQSGLTSILFNSGLMIGGLLYIVFAVGLYALIGQRFLGKIGSAFFAVACSVLIAIGIFNESFSPIHYVVSVVFFVFLPISMLVLSGAFWTAGNRKIGVFTLLLGLAAAAPWVLQFAIRYVENVAIPEFVSGLVGAFWSIILSYVMIRKSE
jgi:hypothetical membrane protein